MALISPGVEVSIIDQSQFTPTAAGTVAYVLLATAQDKLTQSGTTALGTTLSNTNNLITVTSQRDLINLFGTPTFQVDASGNPINGDERNEYGLLAAYSALGVSNRMFVQRANIDLNQLEGSSIRPTGDAADGTYWLDLENTSWGIFEWNVDGGFSAKTPIVITDTSRLNSGVPLPSVGVIGDYAVVATSSSNPVYYKGYTNRWSLVGSNSWKSNVAIIDGQIANPGNLSIHDKIVLNQEVITTGATTMAGVASAINSAGVQGVTARVTAQGTLELFADETSASSGNVSIQDGQLYIAKGTAFGVGNVDLADKVGLFTTLDGLANNKTILGPTVAFDSFRSPPAWRTSDTEPRPYGSVWFKTSATGGGANWGLKEYNEVFGQWILLPAPLYADDTVAVQQLDFTGGGAGLAVGTVYVKYDTLGTNTGTFKPLVKNVSGILKVTGNVAGGSATYSSGDSFTLEVSVPSSLTTQSATVTLSDTTASSLVADILAVDLPNLTATIESSGAVSISHLAGGTIKITLGVGNPLSMTGILADSKVQTISAGSVFLISPFTSLLYSPSSDAPFSNPSDGQLWYWNNPLEVDIMVHDGNGWSGYKNVTNDARGYDLSATDASGVILSATRPLEQTTGGQLVSGDLWIDTSDLENWPVLYRYDATTQVWDLIDKTDEITADGIIFADARWAPNGTTNPVTDEIGPVTDLLTSDYLDFDAPDYRLYPRGSLLFNTRRSGFNVKAFESTALADDPASPAVVAAWVTRSGADPTTGLPYFGRRAQRSVVVRAMKEAIAASTSLREEQTQFNLIVAPGYPELIQDMIALNNDRKNTAFIIGDTPLTLSSDSTVIDQYTRNAALAADNGEFGLTSFSEYLGVYYPSGLATNLNGTSVVVPPSHMMLRTFIRSDNQSYPWFAPAGVRRGVIDNVSSIGFVDVADGNVFRSIGVTQGLRDVMYTNKVNPLTVLPGVGLVAYGQKTRASQTSAMDRINVSRLVAFLRLVLDQIARPFIFEPNDTITRNQVKSGFEAVLNDIVAKRGIFDYIVVCDTTNNTPDRIDRNELYIDIAIKPVKAIEFIYIPVRLINTGAPLTIV